MSYLLPPGTQPRTRTKWGLGALRFRAPLFGRWGMRGLGALGDPVPVSSNVLDSGVTLPDSTYVPYDQTLIAPAGTPLTIPQPGVDPSTQQAYKNLLTQAQASTDPLDYVSPQAAIAAGVDPTKTYSAWSSALAKFPTQQAALQAGVPAGVVSQLWSVSRSAAPTAGASWIDQSSFGVPNKFLLLGGAGIALLAMMKRGR